MRHRSGAGIGVYSTALSTGLTLKDFFLTSQFPDFLTPPVGGFINNILRGLLRMNYELCTYNAALKSSVIGQKHSYEGTKASLLEGRKPDLTVSFGQFPYYWIRDGKILIRDAKNKVL